jgi:branched-chain amino acid transport system ATP-binding protein
MPLLELRGVSARYGPLQALHGIDLSVGEGEIVAVLGANGAGKTTTLRAISATVRTSGDIVFAGERLPRHPEAVARAGIAHVPEGRGTFAQLSVEENLRLGAHVRRDRAGVKADRDRVLRRFPILAERRRQAAGTLSGGEQQQLALARALMQRPRLLLLDEPSLGLAPLVVAGFYDVVSELNEREGLSVLVVEQNARLALASSSRAYVRRSYLGY